MRPLRILLVDDDAVISTLIAEVLSERGHDICGTVRTELAAVDAAARHCPDLMIVDVLLGEGNGVSAMAEVLRRTAMPHIFMTGGSPHGIPADAAVLFKPFGATALLAALDGAWRPTEAVPGTAKHA